MFDRVLLRIQIKYAVLLFGVIATILVCVYAFSLLHSSTIDIGQKIQTLAVVFASGIGLTTLIYTAININAINRDSLNNKKFKRQQYSSYFIKTSYSYEMDKSALLLRDYKQQLRKAETHDEKESIKTKIRNHSEAKIALVSLLNLLEHMCQEIENGMADEEYLRDFFHGILIDYYHMFLWFISESREDTKSAATFCHLENIAKKWS